MVSTVAHSQQESSGFKPAGQLGPFFACSTRAYVFPLGGLVSSHSPKTCRLQ